MFPNQSQWGPRQYMSRDIEGGHLDRGDPPIGEGQGHGGLVICSPQRGCSGLFPLT